MDLSEFLSQLNNHVKLSSKEQTLIKQAYEFGTKAHQGQKRASGQDYFTGHCLPVAIHLAEIGMDAGMVVAGLLHDSIEDTTVTAKDIEAKFGKDIAFMVEGVSKLGELKYQGNQRHVESLRKFFVAVASDVRVVILKLCDRWHNLETLEFLPEDKQIRIAEESMVIHGQLASRLAMGKLTSTINDLAFPFADPENYRKTKEFQDENLKRADKTIESMYRDVLLCTTEALGYTPKVDRRQKGLFSLYKKLVRKDWNIEEVFDLIALRIIVKNEADCYKALGAIHARWRPVPGRVKDYIAVPKPNGYQSLHTTIFSGQGPIVEVQIRTDDMHNFAEYGVAAHHAYKQLGAKRDQSAQFNWIQQLGELQTDIRTPSEYLKELKTDFFKDRIFAMTPAGDVIDLPEGATILDFAFAVHTDLGIKAQGGKVNGVLKALRTPLASEDIVEIIQSKNAKPNRTWLDWCVTNLAQSRIKRALIQQRQE